MTHPSYPRIAITMGDPAGIGPEIIAAAATTDTIMQRCRPIVIGDLPRLRAAAQLVDVDAEFVAGSTVASNRPAGGLEVIDLANVPSDLAWGQISKQGGHAAYQYVERASRLAVEGAVDAICTAPLNKAALHAGGHLFPGHTEMLAKLTNTPEVSMMLTSGNLRVVHVTTHVGLIDAVARVNPGLVERTTRRGVTALQQSGIPDPRVGVCGINPHAGENGLFGYGEEAEKIEPAVRSLQAAGLDVQGPLPADTAFYLASRGDFDLIVAMYHDQGHGPVKVLGIEAGVNITVGLPVIRTSVDHGTAFDIAGSGRAESHSMVQAILSAVELAHRGDNRD